MDTQQPANRITVDQAIAIVKAINPGLPDEEEEEDYDINSDYSDWEE